MRRLRRALDGAAAKVGYAVLMAGLALLAGLIATGWKFKFG